MDLKNLSIMSRLYVGALTYDVTDQIIKTLFAQCGAVKGMLCLLYMSNVLLMKLSNFLKKINTTIGAIMQIDPATGKHKGFCFVEYE